MYFPRSALGMRIQEVQLLRLLITGTGRFGRYQTGTTIFVHAVLR